MALSRSKSFSDIDSVCCSNGVCTKSSKAKKKGLGSKAERKGLGTFLPPVPPKNTYVTQSDGSTLRTMHNKCAKHRVDVNGKIIRCLSFFASHPSQCPEDNWLPRHIGEDFLLIDTYTARLMSECECQLLVDPSDPKEEPTIVAVEMKIIPNQSNTKEDLSDMFSQMAQVSGAKK